MQELVYVVVRLVRTARRLKRVFGAPCPELTIDRALSLQLAVTSYRHPVIPTPLREGGPIRGGCVPRCGAHPAQTREHLTSTSQLRRMPWNSGAMLFYREPLFESVPRHSMESAVLRHPPDGATIDTRDFTRDAIFDIILGRVDVSHWEP